MFQDDKSILKNQLNPANNSQEKIKILFFVCYSKMYTVRKKDYQSKIISSFTGKKRQWGNKEMQKILKKNHVVTHHVKEDQGGQEG